MTTPAGSPKTPPANAENSWGLDVDVKGWRQVAERLTSATKAALATMSSKLLQDRSVPCHPVIQEAFRAVEHIMVQPENERCGAHEDAARDCLCKQIEKQLDELDYPPSRVDRQFGLVALSDHDPTWTPGRRPRGGMLN
jgi:hypothetical protein